MFVRFIVSGKSMEPSFGSGDRLLVCKFIYGLWKPRAGDAIVLRDPRDGRLLLKRIAEILPDGYFVKGDNENESTDSRTFGLAAKKDIVGRVIFRYFRGNRD
jgi:nickel-type superoxide dismutase maturation protease